MKSNPTLNFVKLALCVLLVAAASTAAFASCGDTLHAMAARANGLASSTTETSTPTSDGSAGGQSIVGLWYVQFSIGGHVIQEAYQIWNAGGTEVHNPNVDPRTNNVCLGAWAQDSTSGRFKLNHRVWQYDANGNFLGTIHLKENVVVSSNGNRHKGGFTLDIYDPNGNFQMEVTGQVTAHRIAAD